jgi:predicted small lipoprotein YifL
MRARLVAGGATLVLLAGCGQKGPLYLPDKNATAVKSAPASAPASTTTPDPTKKKSSDSDDDTQSPK